ncbi:MAG: hypothetical protein V1810_03620 [Candidatus Beckwithbacteria bacterium]
MKKFLVILAAGVLLTGCVKKTGTIGTGQNKVEEFTGNLKEAMAKNLPMKCEWKQNNNSGASYVKGDDIYVETIVDGKNGFIIMKDNCMWSWGDQMEQGVKFCSEPTEVEVNEDIKNQTGEDKAEGVDWQMEYKCAPAIFGEEKFTPPAGVKFTDMDEMLQGLGNPGSDQE